MVAAETISNVAKATSRVAPPSTGGRGGTVSTAIPTGALRHTSVSTWRLGKALGSVLPSASRGWPGRRLGSVAWKSVRSDGSSRMSLRGHRPTILRIVGGRGIGVLRGLGLLGRITIELTSWGTILAPLPAEKSALRCERRRVRILTLHFNGLPLTLYPDSWQIAMAAFSWLSILTNAKPLSAWNLVSTT